jgi:hypothetical protein
LLTALGQEDEICYGGSRGDSLADFDYSWHRFAKQDSLVSKSRDRTHIMSKQYPSFLRRPFENRRVICTRQAEILHADNVQVGLSPHDAAKDVIVEIFVGCKAQHSLLCLVPTRQEAGPQTLRSKAMLILPAHLGGLSARK